jgi:hypothetical protein
MLKLKTKTEKILSIISDEVPMDLYQRCPFLEQDRKRLGKLTILGKGQKGLIVESKKSNSVIKIGIDEKSHIDLINEVRNHNIFLDKIAEGKFEQKIPEWIKVPDIVSVIEPDQKNPFRYAIERINGNTLKKIELVKSDTLHEYREKISDFSDEEIYIDVHIISQVKVNGYYP